MTDGSAGRRPLRAAIVGAGLMGRWHAHAVAHAGHTVSAIIDPDAARASLLARAYHSAQTAATLEGSDPVDVVHICTPLATHGALAREALDRGSHVIAEKPLVASALETTELLDHAAAAGRLLVPVHQFLFQPGVLRAQQQLHDIGLLLHADFVACTAGAASRDDAEQNRVAVEVLPHPLSLLARLVSPHIADVDWQVRHTRPGELRADGVLAGVSVSALISTGSRPTTNQLRLLGQRGTIAIDLFHGFAVTTHGRATRAGKIAQPFVSGAALLGAASANLVRRAAMREPAYPGLRELVRCFYDAAATGGVAPISATETLAVATTFERIQRLMSPA